ncbi:hypothetical protein [Klebsiella pneumoniae IS53]|nr:hypothetical protein [Klebsiella pneumoniae IS53]CDL51135.1 hypothetical protein [Klebsiella pneumoniae ISC21]
MDSAAPISVIPTVQTVSPLATHRAASWASINLLLTFYPPLIA